MILDLLRRSLRAKGVMVAEITSDATHPQTLEPFAYRDQPRALGSGTYLQPFYKSLLRWRMEDGSRGAVLLDPIIVNDRGRYREDGLAMAEQLFELMHAHYARYVGGERGT